MATFQPKQKFNQDATGAYLILTDLSPYDDDTINKNDIVDRHWELTDADGKKTIVPLEYLLGDSASVNIDKDKYLQVYLYLTATDGTVYQVYNNTALTRQAEYKKYLIVSGERECCGCRDDENVNYASELIEAALIDAKMYNPQGFDEKITAANTLLSSL
jgi:hypothetical protein